ncbi:transcriptional repressor LexA [Cryptosporangium arvum]|uniref:transcriptional repressor LexA n=1 Tax=Cryptosporangium arvum TaxID=80871 RepID=UPI0004B89C17|nr:transcriptional repressor LexA [Cryptosporangium arvum]
MAPPELTPIRQQILGFVRRTVPARGYPPSIREIGVAVGLSSTSSVAHHLRALETLGLISRDSRAARAVDARDARAGADTTLVPLVGAIAAGSPITADENFEEALPLPASLVGHGEFFALRVRGDSMIEAAICDGDLVVVRRQPTAETGDIVAAMLDGEATVKVLHVEDGHVRLLPKNPHYAPIDADDATILGRVVSILRSLR